MQNRTMDDLMEQAIRNRLDQLGATKRRRRWWRAGAKWMHDYILARVVLAGTGWISTKHQRPTKGDADSFGYVLAWRLGRAMTIKYDEIDHLGWNASYWMPLPYGPASQTANAPADTECQREATDRILERYTVHKPGALNYSQVLEDIWTLSHRPDPCANCSNNPTNGGSGVCGCTLCGPTITCQ